MIRRVRDLCWEHRVSEPVFEMADLEVVAIFKWLNARAAHQVGTKSALSWHQVSLRLYKKTTAELMQMTGRSNRTKFRNQVLKPVMEAGWLEMTIPDKPRGSKQQYRLTAKGREQQASLRQAD